MNSSENIKNAFQVIRKTYENIEKLMTAMDGAANECGYESKVQRFLRYKSDANVNGWFIDSFIKVYQCKNAPYCKSDNGFKDDDIYAVEISLEDEPKIYFSKFTYEDINSWNGGFGVSDHWALYWPTADENDFEIKELDVEEGEYYKSIPVNAKVKKTYWELEKAIYTSLPLLDVTGHNMKEKIFGQLDKLKNIDIAE